MFSACQVCMKVGKIGFEMLHGRLLFAEIPVKLFVKWIGGSLITEGLNCSTSVLGDTMTIKESKTQKDLGIYTE